MSFTNLVANKSKLEFKIKNVDLSVVNAVRRIILSEIPCVGFYFDTYDQEKKHINIKKNTSVLHNEFLAHRISLIPLYFDKNEIDSFNMLAYKFVLKKRNETSEVILITTKDFEIYNESDEKMPESFREHVFPKCQITGNYILIDKLRPNLYDNSQGEELDIECIASVDIAQEHARWCAVSQCSYYNSIDPVASQNAFEESAKGISQEEKKKLAVSFDILDKYKHFKKNKYDEPNEFEFVIDSECRLTPKEIFDTALDILQRKVKNFANTLDKLKITNIGSIPNFYLLEIRNENFTLLNVLQSLIYNKCFRGPKNPLEYIGYYQSHPLDNIMFLKIRFSILDIDLKEFLEQACKDIDEYIQNLKDEWAKL